jgi:hypothetical protein
LINKHSVERLTCLQRTAIKESYFTAANKFAEQFDLNRVTDHLEKTKFKTSNADSVNGIMI